jgi:hypothetical protein
MKDGDSGASSATLALAQLLESLFTVAGIKDPNARVDAIGKLQDAGAPHFSALLLRCIDESETSVAAREARWKALTDYQTRLTQALCTAAGTSLSATSAVRALSAVHALAKLHLVHYSRMPRNIWRVAYKIHSSAEKHGSATTMVHAPAGHPGMTTVEQELLRMLMLQVSAPDMMTPQQIEAADRAVERLGAEFTLRQPGVADNPFCYDPEDEFPPRRAKGRTGLSASTRYFGPGMGYDSLEQMVRQLDPGKQASFTLFGKDLPPLAQLNAAEHLLTFWRVDCPYAPPAHSPAEGSLLVSHGYSRVWQHLSTTGQGTSQLSLVDDSAVVVQPPEVWELRGEGGNELGAQVPAASRAWAKCGELVGVTMGNDQHWVGVIRRMRAHWDGDLEADIAVLSKTPEAFTMREVLERDEDSGFSDAAARTFGMSAVNVIIVDDGTNSSKPPNMLVPVDHWKSGRVYELQEDSDSRFLRGTQAIRYGADFVRAIFEWLTAPS